MIIGDPQDIVGAVTILGILIAFVQYRNEKFIQKINLIKSVKAQMNELGPWASYENEGWKNPPTIAQDLRYMRTFDVIFDMNSNVTEQLLLLPGVENFSDKFIANVANFNQNIYRIRSLINFRNELHFCEFDTIFSIHEKFKEFETNRVTTDGINKFFDILRSKDNLDKKRRYFWQTFYIKIILIYILAV